MRVTGDLGFSSLVLVVCLVIPVIGFVIRRKWRLAVSRREEIKRLVVLASEEAARAELEATVVYGAVSVPKNNQCTVCYCPTTTRCARCKAVHYCSGKCQIIHWRQGHKEECRPPPTITHSNDVVSNFGEKEAKKVPHGVDGDDSNNEGVHYTKPIETSFEETPLSDISCSSKSGKDGKVKVESHAEGRGIDSSSESCSSFSGFSASTAASESSDDGSVSESITSNEPERSDGNMFDNLAFELDTSTRVNNMDIARASSPKFAILVDSVDSFTTFNKLSQTKPGFSGRESRYASDGSSGLSTRDDTTAESCIESSGFWEKSLDSGGTRGDTNYDTARRSTSNMRSESGSSLHFSLNSLRTLHAQGSQARTSIPNDASTDSVGINKLNTVAASTEDVSVDSSKVRNSPTVNFEGSNSINDDSTRSARVLQSREDKFVSLSSGCVNQPSKAGEDSSRDDASNISCLRSTSSEKSNYLLNNPDSASNRLKSGKVKCLSRASSDAPLISSSNVPLVPSTTCGDNGVQSRVAISSQVARSCSPNSRNGLKTSVLKVVDQFRGSKLSKHNESMVGVEVSGRYNNKGLFPYDLFVKLYNWKKVELQPCGLVNCGNSCYANAVLQCLAFTPPLTAYFLQRLHSKACINKDWCFTCEFESLVLKANEGKSPLSPIGILSQLQNSGSQLGNGREEDAHEFLRHAIDTMQSVCLMEAGLKGSGSLEGETTLVGLAFGGYLRSKIKCTKCGGKSERQERMMDLTVEIEGDIETLEEALHRFTSTETLDGENKYHCIRCKSYEKAKKKLTVLEAPNVLTIALKRFQSGKFGKLNKPIRFPEILDLAPFMSGTSDKSPIYRLYGVVVHLDIMNAAFSGHYVCYVKNIQNKWFKIDDSTVTTVELERVLTKGAYLLLYARCSPRAPRLIRNKIISPDPKSKVTPSWINGKTTSKSRSESTNSRVAEVFTSTTTLESFYSKFQRLQRILEDSSSDNSSLISSNSDEGSCSTDSTCYSTSTDDFSEYIFGDNGRGWSSHCRNSDSDTSSSSSSSSPLYAKHSPLADVDPHAASYPKATQTHADSDLGVDGPWDGQPTRTSRRFDFECAGGVSLLHSDTTKQYRKLESSRSSSSNSCRETDSERLRHNPCTDVKSDVSYRKSTRERAF
ncbi:Ubiquitin carboxyl-terminal hydrolase [Quillaja saponaria]|uniref:ubiquitinyl hydrolase 1 n=1 Tax=Quillaja saponaria TaxID=32244 RepID=A0AAD7LJ36_QUISA|nr:Ubiquitin carboxyl-terminal hydrolase [Quillaja saponaria]